MTDRPLILVVDDDPTWLNLSTRLLKDVQCDVMQAASAEDALRLGREHKPDLILLDIVMPDMDGRDLCRTIREDPILSKSFVVLISAIRTSTDDRVNGLQIADGFIARPISGREFVAQIKTLLRLQAAQVERDRTASALREARNSLEIRVAERTAELAAANRQLQAEIAERERAESALRDSEKALKRAQHIGQLGNWDWDVQNQTLTWSDEVYHIFGVTRDMPLTYEGIETMVHPNDRERNQQALTSLFASGDSGDFEIRIVRPDGDVRHIYQCAEVTRDERGNPHRIFGIIQDVTASKRAEEELRKSEARYRSYVDNAPNGVFIVDDQGNYVEVNPAACRITGYSKDELLSMGIADLMPKDEPGAGLGHFAKVVEDGQSCGEVPFIRKDGARRHWSIDAVRLSDTRFLGFVTDITDRKLVEAQFRQAQKMGAIGRMAGGIAHDFNNLLTAIIGYANFALEECPPDSIIMDDIRNIVESSERAASLVRRLMILTRHQVVAPQVIDLNTVILELETMLRRLISERIEMLLIPGEDLSRVKADPHEIERALINLIVNANDAISGIGKITIETGNRVIDDDNCAARLGVIPGSYVVVIISDDGCGLSGEAKEHLFEPFFTTKDVGKGAGLGLATVYGIMQQHGGYVRVDSEPGRGMTVELYFPVTDTGLEKIQTRTEHQAPLPRGHETVLVVEDEPAVRRLLVRCLVNLGYSVSDFANGREALEWSDGFSGTIDLLLSDVTMPHMGGLTLAAALKTKHPDISVLFITGYADHTASDSAGMLHKPFDQAVLAREVRRVLDKHAGVPKEV